MPGDLREKAVVLDHVAACVRPGARLRRHGARQGRTGGAGRPRDVPGAEPARRDAQREGRPRRPAGGVGRPLPVHTVSVHGCTALFEAEVG
ncbi:hypothetical protein NKH77_44255 [Streptomyces sp. M19]